MHFKLFIEKFVRSRRNQPSQRSGNFDFAKKRLACELLESRLLLTTTTPLRIVAYNIAADIYSQGVTAAPQPAMETVLEGIGNETVNGMARPIDILALEETTSNAATVAPIVTALNAHYGSGTYVASFYQATTSGGGDGDGPNAIVYNAHSLTLISTEGIGNPSASSYPRQPVRYEFRPLGGSSVDDFYVYVSHYKSGDEFTDDNGLRRQAEAQSIRADEATLPASARVLYVGDYNIYYASDAGYAAIAAPGQGEAIDPINSPHFHDSQTPRATETESASSLNSRLDLELTTQNVLTDPNGLYYTTGSYHAFGNDGSVSNVSRSTTALAGLPNRTAVLNALVTASDHLPIVADYTDTVTPIVGPSIDSLSINPSSVAAGASVMLTATNVVEHGAGSISGVSFYRESNGTSGLQVGSDALVGTGSQAGANWTLNASTSGLGGGVYTYYTQATDNASKTSEVVSNTLSVSGPSTPAIGSFTANPGTLSPGAIVTLAANNVTKAGGTISRVTFYRESNGIAGLQIGSDTPLGTGTQGGSSWYDSIDTTGYAGGIQFFYAVATDTTGASSATASASVTITAPQVIGVLVDGTAWTSDYLNALQAQNLGQGGYAIPVGSSHQIQDLPWLNIDQIQIKFSQDVSVPPSSLTLSGVAVSSYAIAQFEYDESTFTATWTLAAPIGADRLQINLQASGTSYVTSLTGTPLDGEWNNSVSQYPSGNGMPGGNFTFNFNVLPADINQDGTVNGLDISQVASSWLQVGQSGDPNGDGVINGLDVAAIASHWLTSLPVAGGSGTNSNFSTESSTLPSASVAVSAAVTTTTDGAAATAPIGPRPLQPAFAVLAIQPSVAAIDHLMRRSIDEGNDRAGVGPQVSASDRGAGDPSSQIGTVSDLSIAAQRKSMLRQRVLINLEY